MGKKYTADVRMDLTVEFEDDGETELEAQAWDKALEQCGLSLEGGDGEVLSVSAKS